MNVLVFNCSFICIILVSSISFAGEPDISKDVYSEINNSSLYHVVAQDELYAATARSSISVNSAGAGLGFIGAIFTSILDSEIDKGNAKKANKKISPLITKLKDFDFRGLFDRELKTKITEDIISKDLFNVKSYGSDIRSASLILEDINKQMSEVVIILNTNYYLQYRYKVLMVSVNISIMPKLDKKKEEGFIDEEEEDDEDSLIFSGKVVYQSNSVPDGVDAIKYWAEDDRLKNTLIESINILPDMVVMSLLNSINGMPEGERDYWKVSDGRVHDHVTSGELIKISGDRVVIKISENYSDVYVSLNKRNRYIVEEYEGDSDGF